MLECLLPRRRTGRRRHVSSGEIRPSGLEVVRLWRCVLGLASAKQPALTQLQQLFVSLCSGGNRKSPNHPYHQRKLCQSPLILKPWVCDIKEILNTNEYTWIDIYMIESLVNRSILFCIPEHAVVLYAL